MRMQRDAHSVRSLFSGLSVALTFDVDDLQATPLGYTLNSALNIERSY